MYYDYDYEIKNYKLLNEGGGALGRKAIKFIMDLGGGGGRGKKPRFSGRLPDDDRGIGDLDAVSIRGQKGVPTLIDLAIEDFTKFFARFVEPPSWFSGTMQQFTALLNQFFEIIRLLGTRGGFDTGNSVFIDFVEFLQDAFQTNSGSEFMELFLEFLERQAPEEMSFLLGEGGAGWLFRGPNAPFNLSWTADGIIQFTRNPTFANSSGALAEAGFDQSYYDTMWEIFQLINSLKINIG